MLPQAHVLETVSIAAVWEVTGHVGSVLMNELTSMSQQLL